MRYGKGKTKLQARNVVTPHENSYGAPGFLGGKVVYKHVYGPKELVDQRVQV